MYLEAKKEAKQVVRKAKNEEWIMFGESLPIDFVKNQRNCQHISNYQEDCLLSSCPLSFTVQSRNIDSQVPDDSMLFTTSACVPFWGCNDTMSRSTNNRQPDFHVWHTTVHS